MNNFSEQEIREAKKVKQQILSENIPEINIIYTAGEICMWDELQKSDNWIKIEDGCKMPEMGTTVILWMPLYQNICSGRFDGQRWCKDNQTIIGDATHYQPLPQPPVK